ncbi:DUF5996 family protein [Saccharopolyspora sp. NPDC050389]|uniref:DUF5996 family protein n=1 Tax=Saccharopolyspora sp. NPDC050389 TaxID=3155516 RepID=UPI00340D7A75
MANCWWQILPYVTARGLSISLISHGARSFDIEFDFCEHCAAHLLAGLLVEPPNEYTRLPDRPYGDAAGGSRGGRGELHHAEDACAFHDPRDRLGVHLVRNVRQQRFPERSQRDFIAISFLRVGQPP